MPALVWYGLDFPVVLTALLSFGFNALVLVLLTEGPVAGNFDGIEDPQLMAVQREVARRLSDSLRKRDLIGRVEDAAFAVVLRDCPPDSAVMVAERILEEIAGGPIWISGEKSVEVTACIGLTPVAAGHPPALDHLLNRAARALYFARERGPGRVGATGMPEGRDGHGPAGAEAPVPG